MKGFLGTGAPFGADANLIVQVAMGAALLAGACLARWKRYRAHAACQTAVLVLNLVMIALVMWPSFQRQVLPPLPKHLGDRYYAVAVAHTALGTAVELFGLYIMLVACTNIVPRRVRFQRWKLWMRAALALWWVVVLSGAGLYYTWYLVLHFINTVAYLHPGPRGAVAGDESGIRHGIYEIQYLATPSP